MIPLAIGDKERAELLAMKAYALGHPLTMEQLRAACESPGVQRYPQGHYTFLPIGFEVGLTYELQEKPVWHFSMSLHVPGRVPSSAAVRMVLAILLLPPIEDAIDIENYDGVLNFWFRADEAWKENLQDHVERQRQKRMERLLKPKSSGAVKRRGCHE